MVCKDLKILCRLCVLLWVAELAACDSRLASPTPAITTTARPTETAAATVRPATFEPTASSTSVPAEPPSLAPKDNSSAPLLTGRFVLDNFEDIFVANADGSGLQQLTDDPGPEFDAMWSPDGAKIVYRDSTRGINQNDEIYVMNADGSDKTNLTNDPADDWGPAWSPDGTQIAFNSTRESRYLPQIFVMDADGSNVRQLTKREGEYPSWSPDGSRIVFMSQEPTGTNNYEIYVMNSDGSGLTRLTDSPGSDGWPVWSPDGTRIAFTSVRDDCRYSNADDCQRSGDNGPFHNIWVMNADGSSQRRLTEIFGQFMTWSPDSKWIAFGSYGGLHLIKADGSSLVRVQIPGLLDAGLLNWTK